LQKYTRGQDRAVLEKTYATYRDLLVDDTYPTREKTKALRYKAFDNLLLCYTLVVVVKRTGGVKIEILTMPQ
jgi:hypothetical protein